MKSIRNAILSAVIAALIVSAAFAAPHGTEQVIREAVSSPEIASAQTTQKQPHRSVTESCANLFDPAISKCNSPPVSAEGIYRWDTEHQTEQYAPLGSPEPVEVTARSGSFS